MHYRDFGRTGLKVSEIGFGAWAIGGNRYGNSYGNTCDRTSVAALRRAVELGLNFFDTADVYGQGHSEELIGQALAGQRRDVIIATKVGADFYRQGRQQNFSVDYVRFALEKSLKRLRTDYIDVYLLHNPPLALIEKPAIYEVLYELKREGKIRAWGISIFDPIEGITALNTAQPDCIQVACNIFNHSCVTQLIDKAWGVGCAIIAREPLANGFLTGKYTNAPEFEPGDIRHAWPVSFTQARIQAARALKAVADRYDRSLTETALKFLLGNEKIATVITGIKTEEQAEENADASAANPLLSEEIAQIESLRASAFGLG